jgi:YidC/Oxa1 family membrane protein insertase
VIGSVLSMIQQYVISGWGSLANYLKFLPTTGGLLPPITPAAIAASASASTNGGTSAIDEPPAEKVGFWDVLRPLVEQGQAADHVADADVANEQALNEVRRQMNQSNPRRRRARRS